MLDTLAHAHFAHGETSSAIAAAECALERTRGHAPDAAKAPRLETDRNRCKAAVGETAELNEAAR